ncbi:hypothetical protein [Streptococcus thermophilus]|uniref:hypothetical protein n=1 Tax=Streptococcus thermophilus TaxID=1308 RepID=UPI0021ABEDA0|nr:hypothetical protein [Streptococcus thermophilus]
MIDKKVIEKRKQDDYINKLHRTILELRKEPPEPEPWYRHPEMRAFLDRIYDSRSNLK